MVRGDGYEVRMVRGILNKVGLAKSEICLLFFFEEHVICLLVPIVNVLN